MIADDVIIEPGAVIYQPELVNLYGCKIGAGSKVGAFVEIRSGVVVGRNVKIQAFAFIPQGVTIEDGAFIGPHVCFTNDLYPSSVNPDGTLKQQTDWRILPTLVKEGASLGANATILCGLTIGRWAMVGAGAVVTRDVPDFAIVTGVPARVIGNTRSLYSKNNSALTSEIRRGSSTTATLSKEEAYDSSSR